MAETIDIMVIGVIGVISLVGLYFYPFITLLFLIFMGIIFFILNMMMKKQLKKLQEGYDAKEDKSKPVGKFNKFARTSEGDNARTSPGVNPAEPEVIATEPVPARDTESGRREVLPDTPVVSTGEPNQQLRTNTVGTKKPKRTLRQLFKRRK